MSRRSPAVVLLGAFGRDFVADAVGPAAASPVIAIACLSFLSIGSVVREAPRSAVEILVVLASLLTGFAIFLAFSAIARRSATRGAAAAASLAAFALSEVARTLTYDIVLGGLPAGPQIAHAVVAGALTGITFLGGAAALVNGARRYREHYALLVAARIELDHQIDRAHDESRRDRRRLVDSTKEVLVAAFRDALGASARTGDVGGAVLSLVDSTIRPLSRRLDDVSTRGVDPVEPPRALRVRPLLVVQGAADGDAFDPRPLLSVIALLALGTALFWTGPGGPAAGAIWLVAVMLTAGGALMIAHLLIGPWMPRWPLALRGAVVVAVYVIVMSATALVDAAIRAPGTVSDLVYAGIVGAILPILLTALRGLAVARSRVLQELRDTNARISRVAARELAIMWSEQRELARAVHRDVQAAAIAAAWRFQIDTAGGGSQDLALHSLRQTITEAIELLGLDPEVPSVVEIGARARATWEGICEVEFAVSSELADELDTEPGNRRIIAELLTEFVTNAVKHGRAGRALAEVTPADAATLQMRFWNDGLSVDLSAAQGFGLNDVVRRSIGFEARNVAGGVEFSVRLAR